MHCSFNPDYVFSEQNDSVKNWNYIGTGEFSILDTFVTGVTTSDGSSKDGSSKDEVIGASIMDSGNRPFAKMVDFDTDWQEIGSAIYGMVFRIVWSNGSEAMKAKWTSNVMAQCLWNRNVCVEPYSNPAFGSQSTTTLTDITWGDLRGSQVLELLKNLSDDGNKKLQVSVSFSAYSYRPDESFTVGDLYGTIGLSSDAEPLNYGGDRLLLHQYKSNNVSCPTDLESNFKPAMFNAPFKLNEGRKVLSIDLSNSIQTAEYKKLLNIGILYAGIMNNEDKCIELLGNEIPYCANPSGLYCSNDWFRLKGGIVDIKLSDDHVTTLSNSASLVIAIEQNTESAETYKNCAGLNSRDTKHILKVMLMESEYYVRPMEKYTYPVQPSNNNYAPVKVSFLVLQFGKPVKTSIAIKVTEVQLDEYGYPLPRNGVVPNDSKVKTNDVGIATFTFTVKEEMSPNREYSKAPCCTACSSAKTISMLDGQVYVFNFCISEEGKEGQDCQNPPLNPIAIRAFSNPKYQEPYTWVDHVQPIFHQFHHLYPVMHGILNLSNYYSVIAPKNLGLLKIAMSLDINDPNYMPVTRDLPEPQKQMILKWLENPKMRGVDPKARKEEKTDGMIDYSPGVMHEITCNEPNHIAAVSLYEKYVKPPVCSSKAVPYNTQDYCKKFVDRYYYNTLKFPNQRTKFCPESVRPLYKYKKDSNNPEIQKKCNAVNLQKQLQIGLQLELATIPLYATSLYSIADGCNTEVSRTIRGILMQEMLHMALVGNIMNAMKIDIKLLIDSPEVAPVYPSIGLPGCVHPSLKVYLSKASLIHIYNVLQILEKPHLSCATDQTEIALNTIGQFYNEIEQCIEKLGDQVFEDKEGLQVSWPWTPSKLIGELVQVKDARTALKAINEIVEQGEGASPIDPTVADSNQYGHYYRLMEIICQKNLVAKLNDTHYSYSGRDIPFDSNGVWPMRDNPSQKDITGNCYTEARAFHTTYRRLLKELQATFSGEPEKIKSALGVMESLLVHAKRVMRVPHDPVIGETCGPVWDYDWPMAP